MLVAGAVNARQPSRTVRQVRFRLDYSGGWRSTGDTLWKTFGNRCGAYDGPRLPKLVAACRASNGSYWAVQEWQVDQPNFGLPPWTVRQRSFSLRISHWSTATARLEVYTDWIYAGRFHEVFGRATYRGQPIFGFKTTKSGNPLDTHGRLIFLDTFDSAYGAGWRRENSFVAHNPSGMFCYGLYPYSSYGSYPSQRSVKLTGKGKKYRLTLYGPGVTPDVTTYVDGLPDYDRKNPSLFDWETEMTSKVKDMAAESGDRLCGHH